jgi:hypothetical protein
MTSTPPADPPRTDPPDPPPPAPERPIVLVDRLDPPLMLHAPYAKGSAISILVLARQNADLNRLRLSSTDESVFLVKEVDRSGGGIRANCLARGEGRAEILIEDDQDREVLREAIEVLQPDQVHILDPAPLRLGRGLIAAYVPEARILAGGTGTFLVRYLRGGRALYGAGVLETAPPADLTVKHHVTALAADPEFVQLTPKRAGTLDLPLLVSGQRVGTLPVAAVEEREVDEVILLREDEGRVTAGTQLLALAVALDSRQRTIHGLLCDWTFRGMLQKGTESNKDGRGDLFVYHLAAVEPDALSAQCGAHQATTRIRAQSGLVSRTSLLGCSTVPGGRPTTGAGAFLLLLLGTVAVRVIRTPARMKRGGRSARC